VATYGKIAALAGLPTQARLVGYALHALPRNSKVPWHRVINAQRKISIRSTSDAAVIQRSLLEREVCNSTRGSSDLAGNLVNRLGTAKVKDTKPL